MENIWHKRSRYFWYLYLTLKKAWIHLFACLLPAHLFSGNVIGTKTKAKKNQTNTHNKMKFGNRMHSVNTIYTAHCKHLLRIVAAAAVAACFTIQKYKVLFFRLFGHASNRWQHKCVYFYGVHTQCPLLQ